MGGGGDYHRDVPTRSERRSFEDMRQEHFVYTGYASDAEAAKHPNRREVHKDLNIKGKIRECRDSNELPETEPLPILMDVTKSRGNDIVVMYEKVPGLIGRLKRSGIMKQPVISWGAFGDASCGDQAPVQISQFESDKRIDEQQAKVWIEEGGGGTGQESAELIAYAYARHTDLDCNKRGKKGTMFIMTDEGFYPYVYKDQVKVWIGDDIPQDIPSALIFQELQKKYDVFLIFPKKSWQERKADIDKEIADRVTKAGGMVEGVAVRASLLWNNRNDLDLHIIDPCGHEIFYGSYCKSWGRPPAPCGGWLDVDMNVRGDTTKPVENIRWEKGKAPKGHYRIFVQNYHDHDRVTATDFRVEVEIDGKVQHFEGRTPNGLTGPASNTPVFDFDYDPKKGKEQEDKYALYKDEVVLAQWASVLPHERILVIDDPRACVDTMIGAIALTKGKLTLDEYIQQLGEPEGTRMESVGQTPERCTDVRNALTELAAVGAPGKVDSSIFRGGRSEKKPRKSKRL